MLFLLFFQQCSRLLAPVHHPREWDEPGDLRPGQHSDGSHHPLCPHHPCLVPQNTCALGLLRVDLKHQVRRKRKEISKERILPWFSRLSCILNICKEEVKPFPPVINQVEKYSECFSIQFSCLKIYFGSLDMRLLLNILTETQVRKCPPLNFDHLPSNINHPSGPVGSSFDIGTV